MKERPILFSGPMIRAILAGSKTQTRRVVRPQGTRCDAELMPNGKTVGWRINVPHVHGPTHVVISPYGAPGDHLWVRETFAHEPAEFESTLSMTYPSRPAETFYRADYDEETTRAGRWKPSIFMPRNLSRITLEVTEVRVERLQSISDADAIAEGILHSTLNDPRVEYRWLWESINGAGSWDVNPWVWVVEFKNA